ncbi:hypothetical protein RRG08_014354 [Elysia crispata]|uniref:Uncharacterized protein n=1 Tax=Elysia crispata TaxID=231223 RepID=A0AAE0XNU3_9GAST|nr:hypothetical protein RRG08_014354 [Elysia crispata]
MKPSLRVIRKRVGRSPYVLQTICLFQVHAKGDKFVTLSHCLLSACLKLSWHDSGWNVSERVKAVKFFVDSHTTCHIPGFEKKTRIVGLGSIRLAGLSPLQHTAREPLNLRDKPGVEQNRSAEVRAREERLAFRKSIIFEL